MSVRYFGSNNPRLRWFYLILVVAFLVLVAGLAWRQLLMHQVYQQQEERQNLRRIVQPAPRGRILDTHGNVLVGNRPRFSAVVHLDELRREFELERYQLNREFWAAQENSTTPEVPNFREMLERSRQQVLQRYLDQIAAILGPQEPVSRRDVNQHFNRRLLMPYPLIEDLEETDYARLIEQLPLGSKVDILTSTAREYPHGDLAAHTLGYVVAQANPDFDAMPDDGLKTFAFEGTVGKNGLEAQFNEQLRGRPGVEVCLVDRLEYRYRRIEEESWAPVRGRELRTTLSLPVQKAAEDALAGKVGAAVLLDVQTGEVRALASKPAYNLNDFSPRLSHAASQRITEEGAWLHRAVQGVYPPGSTFKVVTATAALRHDIVAHDDLRYCGPFFRVGDRDFPEHSGIAFGQIDVATMLAKSSNVFCYQIGVAMGIDRLAQEARRFGLHRPTGIELPYETDRMRVPDRAWFQQARGFSWRPGDTANVSIGQGDLRVSPLQMAALTASLARGETRTDVTLLPRGRGQINHGGQALGLSREELGAIFEGMSRATGPGGTASRVRLPGLSIAAKTGTAQVQLRDETLTLAWFIGFAPVEAPEVALAVIVEGQEETDHYAGGRTAAPIARALLDAYFNTFNATYHASGAGPWAR